jgi:hypothetical protein
VKFTLSKTDASMANALRRVMMAEVPTMAIDKVEFLQNTTVLHDDFIAHRLGLVPLVSSKAGFDVDNQDENQRDYQFNRDCSCQGYCPNCTAVFELNVKCDGDLEEYKVTTNDLKPEYAGSKCEIACEPGSAVPSAAVPFADAVWRHAHSSCAAWRPMRRQGGGSIGQDAQGAASEAARARAKGDWQGARQMEPDGHHRLFVRAARRTQPQGVRDALRRAARHLRERVLPQGRPRCTECSASRLP